MNYESLIGRINETIEDLIDVVERAELLLKKSEYSNDDCYLDGAALNVHGFYSGVERIFLDIARTLDQSLPANPNWHKDLLLQMSATLNKTRPPVIQKNTRHCLEEYLSFRHVIRNIYAFNLKTGRVKELVQDLRNCFNSFKQNITEFISFLETMDE